MSNHPGILIYVVGVYLALQYVNRSEATVIAEDVNRIVCEIRSVPPAVAGGSVERHSETASSANLWLSWLRPFASLTLFETRGPGQPHNSCSRPDR